MPSSTEQQDKIIAAIKELPNVKVFKYSDGTFAIHQGGKISIESKLNLESQSDLAMAYTPGVGRICRAIAIRNLKHNYSFPNSCC